MSLHCFPGAHRWKLLEQFALPPPEHNTVSLHGRPELPNDLFHLVTPFLFSQAFQSSQSHIVFLASALLVGQVSEFHRLQDVINEQGGAESGVRAN